MGEDQLQERISAIVHQVKREMKEDVEEVIHAIKQVRKDGLPTPVLSVCGHGTQEIRFTKYFAYFLDATQFHGMGDRVLKAAFEPEARQAGLALNWYENCEVYSEYPLGYLYGKHSYVDILIKGQGFVLSVEQKLFSGESNDTESDVSQLQKYSDALHMNEQLKNLKKVNIYLTPNGRLPGNAKDWRALSHDDISQRLIRIIDDPFLSDIARGNVMRLLFDFNFGPQSKTVETIQRIEKNAQRIIDEEYGVASMSRLLNDAAKHDMLLDLIKRGV